MSTFAFLPKEKKYITIVYQDNNETSGVQLIYQQVNINQESDYSDLLDNSDSELSSYIGTSEGYQSDLDTDTT